jgi:hypothetical protein
MEGLAYGHGGGRVNAHGIQVSNLTHTTVFRPFPPVVHATTC